MASTNDKALSAAVNGASTFDHDLLGQPLGNEVRGQFFVKYVFDAAVEGDANGDGWVNLGDFGIVKAAFGAVGEAAEVGDLTGDGQVDLTDFGQLKLSMSRAQAQTVPEPTALALAVAGLAVLLCRRLRAVIG